MKLIRNIKSSMFKYFAVVPVILILVLLTVYPIIQLIRMGFSDLEFVEGQIEWTYVGIDNIRTMLKDSIVSVAFRNTMLFVVLVVSIESFIGLVLAFMVSREKLLGTFYRGILLLPLLIPPIAIGSIWRIIFNPNFGPINQILSLVGLTGQTWLSDPKLAFVVIIMVDVWHWSSFMFIIMLAGIESIPQEVYEAARVDGASEFRVFLNIVIPLLGSTITVAMMLRTIFAFKVFDEIYLLTSGGPGTATEVISLYIYKVFFGQWRLGYGALLAIVLAIITSIFVIIYRKVILKLVGKGT
jgi:multiple sugar transport system permease protein